MIFLTLRIRSTENEVGACLCLTDFEVNQAISLETCLRHIAHTLLKDATKRLSELEGYQRFALHDKVCVEARRSEAIGCEPAHLISAHFPAAIVKGNKNPVEACLELTAQYIVKLGLMVVPEKKAPTQ